MPLFCIIFDMKVSIICLTDLFLPTSVGFQSWPKVCKTNGN